MIPRTIHYVWLSGEEKPEMIKDCIQSWHECMPDYEIREWSMKDIEHISSPFLREAIAARKWAFATDYLRFYIIYNHGGIYLDSDVYTYRSFDQLIDCHGFTSLEASGILKTENDKLIDFGLEAAIFGAEVGSPWIKGILDSYSDVHFVETPEFCLSIIAPKVMWEHTIPFGLRKISSFQLLQNNIRIYNNDVFSCIADINLYGQTERDYRKFGGINPMRYACHLCSNSWGWQKKKTFKQKAKDLLIKILGAERAVRLKSTFKNLISKDDFKIVKQS